MAIGDVRRLEGEWDEFIKMKIEELPKPSLLVARLGSALFLPNALGKAELEQAAVLIILVCAEDGDVWRGVVWPEVAEFIKQKIGDRKWRVFKSPYFRPDAHGLCDKGFATKEGTGEAMKIALEPEAILKCALSLGVVRASTETILCDDLGSE